MITIQDSINLLTLYFIENASIKFVDLPKLIPKEFKKENEKELVLASIIGALTWSDFANNIQIVNTNATDVNSIIYVLKQPLFAKKQTLQINGTMATQISQIVNSFLDSKHAQCNPLQIEEADIQHLINIIEFLSNENAETTSAEKNNND